MAPLPASLPGSVYNIKARRAQTGGHAKAHPSSLLLLSALRDGLCARATSKTPAETLRLRAVHAAGQSLRADNRWDHRLPVYGVGVFDDGHGEQRRQ